MQRSIHDRLPAFSGGHESQQQDRSITVQRPRVSGSPEPIVTMEQFQLDISIWNRNHDFFGIVRTACPRDRRLNNPQYLVFQSPLPLVVNNYHHFTLSHLKLLASLHKVTYRGRSKYEICPFLLLHECSGPCESMLYIFKERSKARGEQISLRLWTQSSSVTFRQSPPNQIQSEQHTSVSTSASSNLGTSSSSSQEQPGELSISAPETTEESAPVSLRGQHMYATMDHLKPPSEASKRAAVKEWQAETKLEQFMRKPCASCSGLRQEKDLERVHATKVPLRLLQNDDLPSNIRPIAYNFWEYERAILEPQALEDKDRKGWMDMCRDCLKDLDKGNMPRFALCNWLYYARDRIPTSVKDAFRELSVFEKALICRVRTNSLMCRFSGLDDSITDDSDLSPFRNRVRHIRGNIISSPMDVAKINDILPPSPSVVADTICALIIGRAKPNRETIEGLEPILVRKSRIKKVLEFLIANNPHYKVSRAFRGFSAMHLNALFTGSRDIGVPDCVRIGYIPQNEGLESAISDYTGRLDGVEGLFMENVAYTLGDRTTFNLEDMSLQALQQCKSGKPFLLARPGSTPVPDIHNPNWLSWAHPYADPFGVGAFHEPRRKRAVSMEQQLKHLLNVYDPFFETDPTIAFDVYNILRKNAVNTSLRFSVPYASYSRVVNEIVRIDKNILTEMANKYFRNPSYKPETPEEAQILRTMSSISPIARNVPGSASLKIRMRNEIRAIISQRGSPTLFITLNPADYHHPIVAVLAKRCKSEEDIARLLDLTENQRANIALRHPVACAQFFDTFIRQFVRTILRCGRQRPGIFGHCDAYYGSVETQGRGTLHCHLLVWLRGHPPPETLYDALRNSEEHRTKLTAWLDSIIDTGFIGSRAYLNREGTVTEEELRKRGERHPGTIIGPQINDMDNEAFWSEANEYVDDLLVRFNWHDHKSTCWKYLKPGEKKGDKHCRFGMDGKVRPTTVIDLETGAVTIKRKHPKMTQYNPILTMLMKCNTDVKFIGSGEDAKAFMYYVTDYITKAPLSIHAGLSAMAYAIRQGECRGILNENGRDEYDNRRAMTIAINSMLGRQEISHPQAMSYILGNGDSYTNETFQSVNWGEISRYVTRALTPTDDNQTASTADVPVHDLSMSVSKEGGHLNASNQLLDYIHRPQDPEFSGLNLYTFFASTRKIARRKGGGRSNNGGGEHRFSSPLHPQYHTHSLVRRRSAAVPVLLGPRISRRKGTEGESESWARDMCILFKPWRNPEDLKSEEEQWSEAVVSVALLLSEAERTIMDNMSLISEGKHARDKMPRERRRNETSDTLEYPQGRIINEEDDGDEPSAQRNIYQLLEPAGDEENTEYQSSLYAQLEQMIGTEATDAFELCLPNKPATLATQERNVALTNDHDRHSLREQQLFMARCKNRDPAQDILSGRRPPQSATNDSDIPPAATIMTLPETSDQEAKKKACWEIASGIVKRRGLKENKEQMRAFQILAHHAIEGGRQLLMYVGGKGGTGKSYLIEAMVELLANLNRGREVRVGAPTGIAASLIGGNTIHSLLHLNPSNRTKNQRKLYEEWRCVKYLIIDEVSMIGAHLMSTISSKLMAAKSDLADDSSRIFGGINVVFLGDFHQLAPPMQPSLFAHRLVRNPTFIQTRNNKGIDSVAGAYLWRQVNTVVMLKKSKRHSSDPLLGDILQRIRDNRCLDSSGKPVSIRGATVLEHLRKRDLSHIASTRPAELESFADAPVIVGSKMVRDALNACLLDAHAKRIDQRVYLYVAVDLIKGKSPPELVAKRLRNLPTRSTNESLGVLPLFKGMKVMVTENVSVTYKIVNGSEGTVVDVKYSLDERGRRSADVVYVKIPKCTIKVPNLEEGIVPIFPVSISINQPVALQGVQVKSFRRQQVPLVPAYAYTDYKSQGRTLEKAIVDITSSRGQGIYVMLSRVTMLKGLAILRWFPNTKIVQRMSGELREEIQRLKRLDDQTKALFHQGKLAPWPESDEEHRHNEDDSEPETEEDTETGENEAEREETRMEE